MAAESNARLLVVCPYPEGVAAMQRLKYEQYLDDWRAAGVEVTVRPFMGMPLWVIVHRPGHLIHKALLTLKGIAGRLALLRDIDRFDCIYVVLWATPVGSGSYERVMVGRARRVIYDIEDNVLGADAQTQESVNPLMSWLRGKGKARILVERADHVIASSPELAERCRLLNRRGAATYITSSIDTDRFLPVNDYSNEDKVVIGWTGTVSSRPFLDLLRPVFQLLATRRDFRLRVIGNFDYELPGVDLEVLRWSAMDEVAQLQGIDIGVYPLPDDDWVGGKSGLKAIQYMAFGLPCVATAVGHTPDVVDDGLTGLLVRTEREWLAALERLIDDPALRRNLGTAAREKAERCYSTRATAASYRRVIEQVLALPARQEGQVQA